MAPKTPRDKKRVALIVGSLAAHGAVAVTMFVSGVWHIDQLDPGRRTINLAVLEPPAPSGSPAAPAAPKLHPKEPPKHVVDKIVQPVKIDHDVKPDTGETTSTVPGNGLGSGTGSGDNPDGDDHSSGHCVGAACAPPTVTQLPPEPPHGDCFPKCQPKIIAPPMLSALRYAGDTNVVPPDVVKQAMMRDDHKRSTGTFRVCLDANGTIERVTQLVSTTYPEYDAVLRRAIDTWRYHPYQADGHGIPACGMVTFVYTIR